MRKKEKINMVGKPTKEEIEIFELQCNRAVGNIEGLLNEKFLGYGKDSLLTLGEKGVADTVKMKVIRLLNMLNGAIPPKDNSIEDCWRDLAGWSILGAMLYWKTYPGLPLAFTRLKKEQKIRLVYLAGPIDFVAKEESEGWRVTAAKVFNEHNIAIFSPAHAFKWVGNDSGAQKLININYTALKESDALFLNLPEGTQTVGSLIELKIASDLQKPIVIWTPIRKSLYLEPFIKEPILTKAIGRITALNGQ